MVYEVIESVYGITVRPASPGETISSHNGAIPSIISLPPKEIPGGMAVLRTLDTHIPHNPARC